MLIYVVLAGLAAIAVLAVVRPKVFSKVKESIAGAWLVGLSGLGTGLYEYVSRDDTWHDLVDPAMLPWF